MPTTNLTYTLLTEAEELAASGSLRSSGLTALATAQAVRSLAGLCLVLAQHAKDGGRQTDALDRAVVAAEAIAEALA